MKKKYRIKKAFDYDDEHRMLKWYHIVQVKVLGFWVDVKSFFDPDDPDFAYREAQELLEKLEEK